MDLQLPANMSEEDVLEIVREVCGDDMTDEELKAAYRSGLFQELCPDIKNYALQRRGGTGPQEKGEGDEGGNSLEPKVNSKLERGTDEPFSSHPKNKEENKTESHANHMKAAKIKVDVESESVLSDRHSHHHKKKKKRSTVKIIKNEIGRRTSVKTKLNHTRARIKLK